MGLLFGDILAVNEIDLMFIWIGGALILLVLKLIWKPLFASTVNYELAEAEGMKPDKSKCNIYNFNGCNNCNFYKNCGTTINNRNANYTCSNG